MEYKDTISRIEDLPWRSYDPKMIIYIDWVITIEFSQSLRSAIQTYPYNLSLKEMEKGLLKTDSFKYDDYTIKGDCHEFLAHFFSKDPDLQNIERLLFEAKGVYFKRIIALKKTELTMTLFSRIQELQGVFKKILKSHDWAGKDLSYYKFFLEKRIELYSKIQKSHVQITDDALRKFYLALFHFYKKLE